MSTEIKQEKESRLRRMKPSEMNSKPGKEQTDQRTRGSKVFCLGENSYQAVIYPESVHYQDKKTGKWQEIDNTLVERENKRNGRYLSNKRNGDLKVELFDAQEEQMVRLTDDDKHSISWYLEEAADVFPEIESRETLTLEKDDPRRKALDKLESAAVYKDIFPGIDLRCILKGSAFKDEMVFCEKDVLRPITMILSVPGLKAERTENGELLFKDEQGETVFDLPPAFMRDAKEDLGEVKTIVEQTTEAAWRVTYVPDMEWAKKAAYPIVLDPAVVTKNLATAIEDNYVASKKPNYTYPYNNTNLPICIGNSTYGTAYSYLRFLQSNLPTISSSYYVTKAYLYMGLKSAPSGNNLVYVKEVLSDWSSHSITYNNQPTIADKPFEYHYYTPSSTVNAYGAYDISNLVRKWYTGSNYGIRFELTGNGGLSLHSSDALYHRPYIVINYVSLAGVQGGLSYESQSVGRAGTGQVSLYNGNLIFTHQDTSMNGNRMPVSVSHVYNSCYYKKDAFGTGLGWTVSAQQYLHKEVLENNSGTYYVYTDDTGARHYFRQVDGKWKDMSGLSLTLTISGNTATITDKSDTRMIFDVPTVDFNDDDNSSSVSAYANIKPLKQIIDACGNTVTFTTNSSRRLTSIMDGARTNNVGRETLFTLNGTSVASIKEPGAPAVDYSYTNGYLTEITYHDIPTTENHVSYYEYYESESGVTDPREGLLKSVTNIDGLKVTYDYTETVPHRVIRMEISNNETVYGGRKYEYKDCLTVVTDLVPDNNNELVDGKKLFYHFNDNGNVVSVNDELGYGCFAQYSDDLPTNHPKILSRLQRSVVNLLKDHYFYSIDHWSFEALDGATGMLNWVTDKVFMGSDSIKLNHTNDAGAISEYQTVTVIKGKTYTFSSYYQTDTNMKAMLRVTYQDAAGVSHDIDSKPDSSNDAWDRLSLTFDVPADSASNTVIVRLMTVGGIGAVWYDCAQLEEGAVANPYNMLLNGDFTFNVNGKPEAWLENSSNTAACKVYDTCTGSKPQGLSPNTMRIYGRGRKYYPGIYQDIPQSGSKGDVYRAGGWSFSYSKPRNGQDKLFCIRVAFLKTGTSSTRENSPSIEWSEEWTDWQFASGPVIAPCNYKSIRFNVDYERNFNYAEFGGFFLHKEEFGQTYDYDDDDNIKSIKNLAGEKSDAKYDSFSNLTEYIQPGRESTDKYTLTWGSTDAEKKKHLLRTTTSPLGIVQANDYDGFGNPTESLTRDSASENVICGTTEYTSNGNYVASQTDARGNTVLSTYDLTTGTLTSVTNPNGQMTSYTYDDAKRVTETYSSTDNKTYRSQNTYADDKLIKVAHNTDSDTGVSVEYNFGYDDLGRQTTVAVGSQNLSTTHYNNDGTVSEIIYGNNETSLSPAAQSVRYSYDEFKRLKGVQFDDDTDDVYKYDYAANGQVGRLTDISLNRTYTSEYDTADRPMRMIQKQNGEHLYTGQVEYDKYNNLKTFKEKVGPSETSVAYRTDFDYDRENKPTLLTYGDEDHFVGYEYDSIGRMLTRTVKLGGSGQEQVSDYEYVAGNNGTGNTTSLISKITHPHAEYEYTYDNMGNIVSWKQSAQTTVSYVYDHMGQLIRVNDPTDLAGGSSGTTWMYEYDRGGNILSKTRYPYTIETPVGDGVTITYNYDSVWKDKLVSLSDGSVIQNIDYDDIGNPLSDGTWTYTWEKGRQLKQMSNTAKTITFDYNHEGLRVRKTVTLPDETSVVTNYTLHGKNIVHMTQSNGNPDDDHELHFFYDASNKPAVVEFDGTKYAYVHDLQGDICQIIDANGTVVVEYTYDAWGQVMSTTGSMADTLGTIQPFRYRGYVYDVETDLYYLRSRYYNPKNGRFISADIEGIKYENTYYSGLYTYCDGNPINRIDSNGDAWFHWLLGAAVVIACAVAVVATAGSALGGISAVAAVSHGMFSGSVASTVAAGAFIGSGTVYGASVISSLSTSGSIDDFSEQATWSTVIETTAGAAVGAAIVYPAAKRYDSSHTYGYSSPKKNAKPNTVYTQFSSENDDTYSVTFFDNQARQSLRIDYQGRPHCGVIPHYHTYTYLDRGNRVERTFSMNHIQLK